MALINRHIYIPFLQTGLYSCYLGSLFYIGCCNICYRRSWSWNWKSYRTHGNWFGSTVSMYCPCRTFAAGKLFQIFIIPLLQHLVWGALLSFLAFSINATTYIATVIMLVLLVVVFFTQFHIIESH